MMDMAVTYLAVYYERSPGALVFGRDQELAKKSQYIVYVTRGGEIRDVAKGKEKEKEQI
jgi:hypothetical protein